MQTVLNDLLAQRRNRAIAIVLGVKERDCDRHLPREVQQKLRKVVLDQFNDLTDFVIDVVKSLDAGTAVVLNEEYLEKLDEVHASVVLGRGRDA